MQTAFREKTINLQFHGFYKPLLTPSNEAIGCCSDDPKDNPILYLNKFVEFQENENVGVALFTLSRVVKGRGQGHLGSSRGRRRLTRARAGLVLSMF